MVIDDFPQWFARLFVFVAFVMVIGIVYACEKLAEISRQLADFGKHVDRHEINDLRKEVVRVYDELVSIRLDVEKIADPDARKRRKDAFYDRILKRNQSAK